MFLFTHVEGKIYSEQMRNESSSDHSLKNMDNDVLVKIFMSKESIIYAKIETLLFAGPVT